MMQYERNDVNFIRNKFRVRGDTVEIFPAGATADMALRVEFFGDTIDRLLEVEFVSGKVVSELKHAVIFPASHYAVGSEKLEGALAQIHKDMEEEVAELREAYAQGDREHIVEEAGDLLFATVNLTRFVKTNPELSLTAATEKFINRFALVESVVLESGRTMEEMTLAELDAIWNQVKHSGEGDAYAN